MRRVQKLMFFLTLAVIISTYRLVFNVYKHVKPPSVNLVPEKKEYKHDNSYGLHIIVIVYNRHKSLLRLLNSINAAEYYSDKIKLQVWIDRSVNGTICPITLLTAQTFKFKFGDYEVIVHRHHVGIYGQWLTTWVPDPDSRDIAVILEDDLTVSKYFYKYLKLVHGKYDNISEINGYSLQGRMKTLAMGHRSKLRGPNYSSVFLYPSMGPWGFSPNNRNWRNFLDWFNSPEGFNKTDPFIPGNAATYMYRAYKKYGKGHTMWTIWHRYYAWKNKEFTMFCNFLGSGGLSANYRESGLHFGNKGKKSNRLLSHWKREFEILPKRVPHLDMAGKVIL